MGFKGILLVWSDFNEASLHESCLNADPIHINRFFAVDYHSARISWSEYFSYYERGKDNIIAFLLLFVCLLCSIRLNSLEQTLFSAFLWCPEHQGILWPTAAVIIWVVAVISQASRWGGFCTVHTYFRRAPAGSVGHAGKHLINHT